ncbi:hypothetical protein L218DRAFT_865025 [Marasmius fiardii PR-910]|nr:hypothetical protein L218DRAFT_865025 [Marasmius fiardii PR-910]
MIKNIPNKMNRDELIRFINQVVERRFDFLYLRMDFSNSEFFLSFLSIHCNFGYAFVNFITVEALLEFAQARLGHKWNMFQSEKVLEMCYANYQGKEAAIEKFKNSSIMDVREEWRPKIFYSEPGPRQGLSEPFPKPTHQRRKEKGRDGRLSASLARVNDESGGADLNLISGRNTSHTRSQNHHADLQMLRPGGGYRSNRRNRGRNVMANGNGGAQAHVQNEACEDGGAGVPSGLVGPAV